MTGRSSVVTGGARGIGFEIAATLARRGSKVRIWDQDEQALGPALAALRALGEAEATVVDVTSEASVDEAANSAGAIDILVNNAGITGPNQPAIEYSLAEWERVLAVDLTGPFLCSRAVVPGMVARG
jgi:2-dehydro-3-deoxy-L-rhamnonate dehydrogenase (NAD+)